MCFYVDTKYPNAKTAKRDITCYKILSAAFTSLYLGKYYLLNHVYVDRRALTINDYTWRSKNIPTIFRGFHSYSNKKKMQSEIKFLLSDKTIISLIQVKCIIPKGSLYYYNHNNKEYVSNQIIIKEIIR